MDRKKMIERVRALLAKTTDNGCSEAEALSAAAKAQALMDEHDIAQGDLREPTQFSMFQRAKAKRDQVVKNLAVVVGKFYGCKVTTNEKGDVTLFGRDCDVVMAEWLLDTLVAHVKRELKAHFASLKQNNPAYLKIRGVRTRERNGFVLGAVYRIEARLRELTPAPTPARNALVATNTALVNAGFADWLKDRGSKLKQGRASNVGAFNWAIDAGTEAGDRASFARPVGHASGSMMIGRGA
ncbi:DUF2786 domain-containing protein [Rhodoblastus acidophilus]|uniref:DUF2786 domain-containing protein n=1 Tax=Rhodoblastus acidophilus TaxID=1074 RepID=A0A6N8DLM2_RHOAC|nr:DUF2786 domain-containing protein [Rhodoblastus acidophilus]MCW2275110.1 hypothetical protein [Rhodoblastus acidophilus]MTV31379.1 DUF2786 domain-containing protein [Rhodoblastus acidophilus]